MNARCVVLSLVALSSLCLTPALADVHLRPSQGTLNGRSIIFSPGHGTYKKTSTAPWRFQRGIVHDLREDIHTNEIFIEYIQRYLTNAGARLESVRERSFQENEVIVDNGSSGYTETGAWSSSTSNPKHYGANYRYASVAQNQSATAEFRPDIPESGRYPVYIWVSKGSSRSNDAQFTVYHSGGETQIVLDQNDYGDHFIFVGEYHFEQGQAGRVVLTNKGADSSKVVVADAVRFGGGIGASGLPRWQEAAKVFLPHRGFQSTRGDVTIRPIYARFLAGGSTTQWREDFLYFALHSNASGSSSATATGLSTFSYSNGRTPSWGSSGAAHYPSNPSPLVDESDALRASVHQEVLAAIRHQLRPGWRDRNLHKMNFGELRECRTMPSALIELGFHDNVDDTALLKNPAFRHQAARAIYKGIIKYWAPNTAIIPLPPTALTVRNLGAGSVRVTWREVLDPLESSAVPTQYKIYVSRNGRGFDNGTLVSGTTTVLSNLTDGESLFVRVAAMNAGGESLPTVVGGALIGAPTDVLIVDGFDRLFRHTEGNINQRYTRDYVVEHLDGLQYALPTAGIDFAQNETIADGTIDLTGYRLVDWMLGRESSVDRTFDDDEQRLVETYLMNGGAMLVSGTEIGWDLEARSGGKTFLNQVLGVSYMGDDAGSLSVLASGTGPLTGIGGFDLDDGTHGRYVTASPDRLAPFGNAEVALTYANGSNRVAGVANDKNNYRVLVLAFPIETVTDENARRSLVDRSVTYLLGAS
ncbi:MAG: N-acetylmuramoyl-L-alanine amidase, partial [Planctomycetota bacterium]|nr:N-acetylmuramoyl-L-alanine amidase [Planctomycetota bacterium]